MGKNSKIEWCDHTFNAWTGCSKVSPGCAHCYAEEWSERFGIGGKWGDNGTRVVTIDDNWRKPLAWDRKAKAAGVRARVFTNSLADVFEDRPELRAPRAHLYQLIRDTPNLDWLLLTKRPENAARLWREAALGAFYASYAYDLYGGDESVVDPVWGPNVWLGTTAEDQQRADERIPHLLAVPAKVRFLSVEPMLGAVDLGPCIGEENWPSHTLVSCSEIEDDESCACEGCPCGGPDCPGIWDRGIHWVICGGESGRNARPMHPDWARSLRDQCQQAGVPFLFKQWGEWAPVDQPWKQDNPKALADNERWMNIDGGHGFHGEEVWRMHRVGKHAAGRLLDGVEHNEFPRVEVPGQ